MTDDLTRELEAVTRSLPELPSAYAELRALMLRLPQPTAPDIQSARAGQTQTDLVASTFGSATSPLTGSGIGSDSGASIGVLADVFGLQANNLLDPTLEDLVGTYAIAAGPSWTLLGSRWRARYTLNSGVAPTSIVATINASRTSSPYSLHSAALALAVTGALTVFNMTIDLEEVNTFTPIATLFGNLVSVCRLALAFPINPGGGSHSIQVHVVNAATGAAVASSTVVDAETLGLGDFRRLAASLTDTSANLGAGTWKFRVSYTINKTAAASDSIGILVGEPQLAMAPTQSPPPFTPLIGAWEPRVVWPRRTDRAHTIDVGTNAVPTPVSHRGFANCAPENTMASFRTAIAYGMKVIETDICWSQDGIPLISHDTTPTRMTGFTGNLDNYDLAELRMFDAGSAYSADFDREGLPSLYDVLNEFGGKATFILEIKVGLSGGSHADAANRIAAIIADYGLERHTIIASFNDLSAAAGGIAWSTYGIPTLKYTGAIAADGTVSGALPATYMAAGVKYVGIQAGIANFGAGATSWGAVGGIVMAWTCDTRFDRDTALAASASVTAILSNDPLLITKPNVTAITVGDNIPANARIVPAGMIPLYQSGGVRFTDLPPSSGSSGQLGWSSPPQRIGWPALSTTSEHHMIVCPRLGWGAAGIGKFSVAMVLDDPSADLTRFGGIGIATDDRGHLNGAGADTSTAYFGILRQNGTIELFRVDAAGVETQIGIDATGAAWAAGTTKTITLEVTATNVIFIANTKTLNIVDGTLRAMTAPYILRSRAGITFDEIKRIS